MVYIIVFSVYIEYLGGNNYVGNTFFYNKVLGNYGNGYDINIGIFIVFEIGIYVFFWVIQVYYGSWCSIRMLRNGFIFSMIVFYVKVVSISLIESGFGTGFFIIYMNQGDIVFVEMNNFISIFCNIVSNDKGIIIFFGWKIVRI